MTSRPIKAMVVTRSLLNKDQGGPGKAIIMLHEGNNHSELSSKVELALVYGERACVLNDCSCNLESSSVNKKKGNNAFLRFLYHLLFFPSYRKSEVIHNSWRRRISKLIDEFRPDLIHCHDYGAVYALPRNVRVPIVFTNHTRGSYYREHYILYDPAFRTPLWKRYLQGIEIRAIDRADLLVFPSESARELLIDDYPALGEKILRKSRVIYTGISDPLAEKQCSEIPLKDRERIVVNIANHVPDKAIDVVLRVFAELHKLDPSLHFVNVGAYGTCTPGLEKLAEDLGVRKCVEFRGVVPRHEVYEIVRRAFLCVHTPVRVVFDLSLLEVMACGTPIVASDAKGNIEALGTNYPLILPLGTSCVSKEMVSMLQNSENWEMLSRQVRKRFLERFTLDVWLSNHIALWEETCAKRQLPDAALSFAGRA